jgi:hypothetical protein
MRVLILITVALALSACHRGEEKSSAAGGSSMQTPKGGATGQASEGSTDSSTAPKRPSSR